MDNCSGVNKGGYWGYLPPPPRMLEVIIPELNSELWLCVFLKKSLILKLNIFLNLHENNLNVQILDISDFNIF